MQRKRKNSLRTVMNGIFYVLRSGCQWRNLPAEKYFPWQILRYGWPNDFRYIYLEETKKQVLFDLIDTYIRDAKIRKAYAE